MFYFNDEKMSAMNLANYIILRAVQLGEPLNNSKLQKILYYVQGHYLAEFRHPLFPEEIFAWRFGPVVADVWYEFSYYAPGSVQLHAKEKPDMSACTDKEMMLINRVIDAKLKHPASSLIRATRSENPYLQATEGGAKPAPYAVIPIESMELYFKTIVRLEENVDDFSHE